MKIGDIVVDRAGFMAWVEGKLMTRDRSGKVTVGDTLENEEAEKVLDAGGTVVLTVQGKLFSTIRYNKKQKACVEKRLRGKGAR